MSESFHTTLLQGLVQGLRAGDREATEELARQACRRLEHLAARMLRQFPGVARWEQTDDVLVAAVLRLMRALGEVQPGSLRDFYALAAVQIRRELLDLARRHGGPRGLGANHDSVAHRTTPDGRAAQVEPADPAAHDGDLEAWTAFHEAVGRLPTKEREVVELTFYHGRKQAEIADLLGVDERSVRRYWRAATRRLAETLRGRLPELAD